MVDVVAQGLFDQKSDYDLAEMLNDASQKVATQKLLLVAHSQGNFYANNFYDKVADQAGGVPSNSIGVYSVATPASRVAGGGKYLTSDTDKVIATLAGRVFSIMPPNTHILLQNGDDAYGHDFSGVYLKYESDKIISDIQSSLNKLSANNVQGAQEPCIAPPKLTIAHKVEGAILAIADPAANIAKTAVVGVYDGSAFVMNAGADAIAWLYNQGLYLAKTTIGGLSGSNLASVSIPKEQSQLADATDESLPNNSDNSTGESINQNANSDDNQPAQTEENATDNSSADANQSPADSDQDSPVDANASPTDSSIISNTGGSSPATDTETSNDTAPDPAAPDTIAPVISIIGDNPAIITVGSAYTDAGATATDDVDGALVVNTTGADAVDTSAVGSYAITYAASDIAGNVSTATRNVKVVSYKYIPNYSFGKNNGDGNDWQIWAFNGSNIYDWSDTYVDNYLREQFKMQTYAGGYWCSQCLQRGIFNHDPEEGFELSDLVTSGLEGSPQNNMNNATYNVTLQWDSAGYTYTITDGSVVYSTGHTDVANMNNDLWVGWDGSFNNFRQFPSGNWTGIVSGSPVDRTGGGSMILQPFPVYKDTSVSAVSSLSLPNKDLYAGSGINPIRGRANLTPFAFQIIYTDKNNNAPQNVKLHVANATSGNSLPEVEMREISPGADILSDGNFANGESYIADNILYDAGDYNYYFTANDNMGNLMRIPENSALSFSVIPSTYTYIPKYSFGTNNGDGNNWQAWSFNGSMVYGWLDAYVDNYLKEQFKIQTYGLGAWCSQCLQRGIFNHDPQKGFELADLATSGLEGSPQNSMDNTTYDVIIQWDSDGYTTSISHNGIADYTNHTNISNVNEDMWVGWDGSFDNFKTFPSGIWLGVVSDPALGLGGGNSMILQPYPVYVYSGPVLSKQKSITAFNFDGLTPAVAGVINEADHTVSLTVPFGTDVTSLAPAISISGASISPNTNIAQNFTSPVTYTVTAENGSAQNYIATVTIAPNPNPGPDTTPPSIASYTFNGSSADITTNPISNHLSIVINASENVNWTSIKIENESDSSFYKYFYPGSGCDGTSTCTEIWDGLLSSGGLLKDGVYKVKVHMKDLSNNDYNDYLSPYVITVDNSL